MIQNKVYQLRENSSILMDMRAWTGLQINRMQTLFDFDKKSVNDTYFKSLGAYYNILYKYFQTESGAFQSEINYKLLLKNTVKPNIDKNNLYVIIIKFK